MKTTVNVGYSFVEVAIEQIAREEKQRVFGIIPNFYVVYDRHPEPLTAKLKFELALRLVRDPITPVGIAFVAGICQAAHSPNYQQNAKGYGQWFGVTAANGLTDIMLGSELLPSLLHQDPRYFVNHTQLTVHRRDFRSQSEDRPPSVVLELASCKGNFAKGAAGPFIWGHGLCEIVNGQIQMSNLSLPCFGTVYEPDQVADGVRHGLQEFQSALSIVQSGFQFGAIGIARRTHFLVEGLNILNCLLAYLVVPVLQLDKNA